MITSRKKCRFTTRVGILHGKYTSYFCSVKIAKTFANRDGRKAILDILEIEKKYYSSFDIFLSGHLRVKVWLQCRKLKLSRLKIREILKAYNFHNFSFHRPWERSSGKQSTNTRDVQSSPHEDSFRHSRVINPTQSYVKPLRITIHKTHCQRLCITQHLL